MQKQKRHAVLFVGGTEDGKLRYFTEPLPPTFPAPIRTIKFSMGEDSNDKFPMQQYKRVTLARQPQNSYYDVICYLHPSVDLSSKAELARVLALTFRLGL